jgi:hypothetical protein
MTLLRIARPNSSHASMLRLRRLVDVDHVPLGAEQLVGLVEAADDDDRAVGEVVLVAVAAVRAVDHERVRRAQDLLLPGHQHGLRAALARLAADEDAAAGVQRAR